MYSQEPGFAEPVCTTWPEPSTGLEEPERCASTPRLQQPGSAVRSRESMLPVHAGLCSPGLCSLTVFSPLPCMKHSLLKPQFQFKLPPSPCPCVTSDKSTQALLRCPFAGLHLGWAMWLWPARPKELQDMTLSLGTVPLSRSHGCRGHQRS